MQIVEFHEFLNTDGKTKEIAINLDHIAYIKPIHYSGTDCTEAGIVDCR